MIYDQRSHGRSARARAAARSTSSGDLDAVLRALAPEGPLVLVGHSMGGMALMALAERRPSLFDERVLGWRCCRPRPARWRAGVAGTLLSRGNPLTRLVGLVAQWQPLLITPERGGWDTASSGR